MEQNFYSNGKLLLSGEYAVLDGALAWAIPTKYGQHLKITSNKNQQLVWKSYDEKNELWFEANYAIDTLKVIDATDDEISAALQNILVKAQELNPEFLINTKGLTIKTELTFPRNWGLGTSSTLINNIALWANVNAQELLAATFGGSGYDISCAQHNLPILYTKRDSQVMVTEMEQEPTFANSLYFVYLNKKKNSRDGIKAYREREFDKAVFVKQISALTINMISCTSLEEFEKLLTAHENLVAEALQIPTVKSELFSDYSGAIKSLGAWGGDFILATGTTETPEYFKTKGYTTVIPYQKMIL